MQQIKRIIMLVFFALLLMHSGCKTDPVIIKPPPDNDTTILPVIWNTPIYPDTLNCLSICPVLYLEKVLISGEKIFSSDPTRYIFVDASTGEITLTLNDLSSSDCSQINYLETSTLQYQNIFVGLCHHGPIGLDLTSSNILWQYECEESSGPNISNYNDHLYHVQFSGTNPFYVSSLVEANVTTGIFDTVFTVVMEDGYSCALYPPGVNVEENGDTLLYFQNRQWNFSTSDGKVDLYCYNMTADSIVWKVTDIDPEGNSNVRPPVIYNGKVYFKGSRTVFCLDAYSGDILWSKYFGSTGDDLLNSNLLIVEDKVIVKLGFEPIYALDPDDGSQIWVNQDAGATPSDMIYFDGVVYYGSGGDGKLHAVRVSDGEEMWAMDSPNKNKAPSYDAYFLQKVAIDPATRRLYAADGYYLMCFQL